MQRSLLDLNLEFEKSEIPFEDELGNQLERFAWTSEPFNNWAYDEDVCERILVRTTVHLWASRVSDKKGKQRIFLERLVEIPQRDDAITDSIECKDLAELEAIFEREKGEVYFASCENVMFDGRRYWWRWREEDGKVVFTERFI